MTNFPLSARRAAMRATLSAAVASLVLGGCKLDVINPSLIDASQFDPSSDAALISLSAQTQWYIGFQNAARYGGLFAEEQLSAAARTETADLGRRSLFAGNQDINIGLFGPLSRAIATNATVVATLSGGSTAATDINLARAEMNLAFAQAQMGETFCQGTVLAGPALTPAQLLDSAITHFTRAITIGGAASGAEATKIVNASRIGLARAYLQKGDNANAATAATAALAAPPSFAYSVPTADSPTNRPLGNQIFLSSIPNLLSVVPAAYQALNDPRVPFLDLGVNAQDGVLRAIAQQKFLSYAAPIRIASYLEAQYVQAEAKLKTGDASFALTLIAARRVAGNQPAFTGTGTPAILSELLNQAARDFWLEGKKLGDWRRNPTAEPFISAPGTLYKGSLTFGALTSVPLPQEETNTNPNHVSACP